ncbi:MAG: winged helix DNA-binding domain-containing protein, partial [Acidobacteria bacterium]|nr:winged helix DNA-binding domain-containing protein [Acidobacteriota bacterium]
KKKTARKSTRKLASRVAKKKATTKKTRPVLDPVIVAAWRMARQGLDQQALHPPRDLAEALGRSGWLAKLSGTTPYLAMVARYASFSRHDLDHNLFHSGTLLEVPAMGGRSKILPAPDAWLALQGFRPLVDSLLKELLSRHRVMTRAGLANLEDVVRAVLAGQALSVETLRTRVPKRLVKELGAAGMRHGLLTTVDLALWHLWSAGEAVSRPVEKRLDRTRREYVLRRDLPGPALTADLRMRPREIWLRELAGCYFRWVGLARAEDLAWWMDVAPAEARATIGQLDLAPASMRGLRGIWYLMERDLESLNNFQPSAVPAVSLVPAGDLLTSCWRSSEGLMAPEDLARPMAVGGVKAAARVTSPAPGDEHFVVIGGRVAGAWQHGNDGVLRYSTFHPQSQDVSTALRRRAAAMAEFIRRELGGTGLGQARQDGAGGLTASEEAGVPGTADGLMGTMDVKG